MKKYPVEFLKTPAGELQVIRDFIPEPKPNFDDGNVDAYDFTVWQLYDRVCESIKSFLILLDNQRFYDAFIIAGHALETCAVLSYVKDGETEAERRENYNKYIARSSAGILLGLLETSDTLEKDPEWDVFVAQLKIFYPIGASIIKNAKNPKEKHEEVIKQINYRLGTNAEKINLITKNYSQPNIEEYMQVFMKNVDGVDEGRFTHFYIKYCSFKHSNILGCLEGQIFDFQIERVVTVILMLVTYLSMAKLEPYVHPVGI